jgi:hypothetical protein
VPCDHSGAAPLARPFLALTPEPEQKLRYEPHFVLSIREKCHERAFDPDLPRLEPAQSGRLPFPPTSRLILKVRRRRWPLPGHCAGSMPHGPAQRCGPGKPPRRCNWRRWSTALRDVDLGRWVGRLLETVHSDHSRLDERSLAMHLSPRRGQADPSLLDRARENARRWEPSDGSPKLALASGSRFSTAPSIRWRNSRETLRTRDPASPVQPVCREF